MAAAVQVLVVAAARVALRIPAQALVRGARGPLAVAAQIAVRGPAGLALRTAIEVAMGIVLGPLAIAAQVLVASWPRATLRVATQILVWSWPRLLPAVIGAQVLVALSARAALCISAQVAVGTRAGLLPAPVLAQVLVAAWPWATLTVIVHTTVSLLARPLRIGARAEAAVRGRPLALPRAFVAQGGMWPAGAAILLYPFLAQGAVGLSALTLALALRAQALVAAWSCCAAAVTTLIYRLVRRAPLALDALAVEVTVGAGEVFLAVAAEVLLFVAEAVCALLATLATLRGVNAGLLASSRSDPLRQQFLW